MNTQPLVSVRLVTYNHEKWIAQCLEGILMQRTDFPFEVIVGEDCSTDHTREIVLAYAERYPDKLRVLPAEANLGLMRNSQRVEQACRGKYHAMVEGDDYWIDPLKLQKQVNRMEAHPDMTLCAHNVFVVDEGNSNARLYYSEAMPDTLTFTEMSQICTPVVSHLARSDAIASQPEWRLKIWCGDVLFRLWCAHQGKVGYLSDVMAVYRRRANGLTAKMIAQPEKRFSEIIHLYEQFDRETGYQHTDQIQKLIHQEKEAWRRQQLGWRYYLLRPSKFVVRLRQYAQAIVRYRNDF
jgi:glycosyltransferase involved in cell wall biosynthesis